MAEVNVAPAPKAENKVVKVLRERYTQEGAMAKEIRKVEEAQGKLKPSEREALEAQLEQQVKSKVVKAAVIDSLVATGVTAAAVTGGLYAADVGKLRTEKINPGVKEAWGKTRGFFGKEGKLRGLINTLKENVQKGFEQLKQKRAEKK